MLYVKQKGAIVRDEDNKPIGIPLFRWWMRDKGKITFFATLRYLDEYLVPSYRGLITFVHIPERGIVVDQYAIEIAIGEHDHLVIYFPAPFYLPICIKKIKDPLFCKEAI